MHLEPGFKVEQIHGTFNGLNDSSPLLGTVRALLKEGRGPGTYELANEYICARLASIVGLPCPPGDFAARYGTNEKYWVSPLVAHESPPPPDAEEICSAERKNAAGTLVFDAWVLNNDRHEENVIYGPTVGFWLIDHGEALCPKGEDPKAVLDQYLHKTIHGHLFARYVNKYEVANWCTRIRGVQPQAIKAAIWPTVRYGLITKTHAAAIEAFLGERAQSIKKLVDPVIRPEYRQGIGMETLEEGA